MSKAQERKKYLVKNTVIFTLGNLGTKMISFFMVPLYTGILTTSEYGVVDLINTISMVAVPILILNINEAVMRFSLDKGADYSKIMSIGLFFGVLSIPLGIICIPIIRSFGQIGAYAWLIYFYVITLGFSQILLSYLRGKEQLMEYSIGNIIQTFSIACFNIFFLCFLKMRIDGYFLAYGFANIITCIYAFVVGKVVKIFKKISFNKKLAIEMVKYSIVLVPNTFMWWIINSSDRVMVTAMVGAAANGIYAISYKVPSMIQIFSNIFNQAWTYSAIKEEESKDRDEYSNKIYNGVMGMAMISGVGVLACIKIFLKYYVSDAYYDAWKYTPFLVIGYVFLTLGGFLATTYTVNKDSKGFLFSGSCGAIINIVLNFVFIPFIGVYGAALATGISYISVFFYRIIDTRKYIKIKIFRRKHILALCTLFLASVTIFINSLFGQILLIVELLVEIYIFSDVWFPMVKFVLKREK